MGSKHDVRPGEAGSAGTRESLLRAAGEVFAELGFRAATVRGICQRAGANIAAVNYHFRDKETLYLEVLRYAEAMAVARHPVAPPAGARVTPEGRLRFFIRSFLSRLLLRGPDAWAGKLLAMEMLDPTRVLDALVEERYRPLADYLDGMVRQIVGPAAEPERVALCSGSVVSQCLFYHNYRSLVLRLDPHLTLDDADLDRLASHISDFSLAALRGLAREASPHARATRTARPARQARTSGRK
jgi:AcrR family transcriptional regulator